MNIMQSVQQFVQKSPRGKPFASIALLKYGGRAAIDQALCRLASGGKLVRLTRGIYVRPEENRFVGQVLPEPFKVAKVIARKANEVIQVNGAEAARQLGLSTQVSVQPVFLTTGPSRCFKVGNLEVNLKHVSRKKIPLAESKVGLAILALWYLGKQQVTTQTIGIIEKKLSVVEFNEFKAAKEQMPAWMSNIVREYEKQQETKIWQKNISH